MPNIKQALIISGGGALGAWGVGVARALVESKGRHYSTVIGTSTGALMGPLILANQFDQLVTAYTSVRQSDIFNVNPFNDKGDIKRLAAAWRVIRGKKTLGESENLKALIKEFFTVELFNELRNSSKTFGATTVSLTTALSEVKVLKDNSYNDIVDWIWASANNPVFMSTLSKDNQLWTDGGLKDYAPINYVLQENLADEIDVILHTTTQLTNRNFSKINNVFDIVLRTIDIFVSDVTQNDIENAKLQVQLDHTVKINFFYMNPNQKELIGNSLIFNKDKMNQILNEGFESVVNNTIIMSPCKVSVDGLIQPANVTP